MQLIVLGAIVGVVKDHDITADVLVALALIGSLILKEFFAAGEVAFIMQIGSILEDFTSDRAKKGISKLIKLSPKKANLFVDGQIKIIEAVKTAGDSSLQRMIKLAETADAQKAKIVRKANVWAAWLVVISLTTAIVAGCIGEEGPRYILYREEV